MSGKLGLMKGLTAAAAGVALAVGCGAAGANVMTFAGIGSSPVVQATYTEDGITATSIDGNFWGFPSGGQLHLDPAGFNDSTYDFTFGGVAFNLDSVAISFASGGAIGTWTAFDSSNVLVATAVMGAGATGTFTFGSGFDGVYRVRLVDTVAHFSIDDLTIEAAAPEPFSLALVGAGLLGLGWSRRRKQA